MSKAREERDYTQPWTYSDIIFLVENKKLYANKTILSMWSPYFEAMFQDSFKEKTAEEIELKGKKFEDVLQLMKVLHPPNEEIDDDVLETILPLAEEYLIDKLMERCEDHLLTQTTSIKTFLTAQKYNMTKLHDECLGYMRRAPLARLKAQPEFSSLDKDILVKILSEKCEKFETNIDSLREVRMVLERKKPTTFPGMHLLCDDCTGARQQQVDCTGCMKSCCRKITELLRNLER